MMNKFLSSLREVSKTLMPYNHLKLLVKSFNDFYEMPNWGVPKKNFQRGRASSSLVVQ